MTADSTALDEARIRKLMGDRVQAVRTRDVNASMSNLAPDILSLGIFRGQSRGEGPNIAWFKDPAGNILSVLEEK